MPRPYHKINMRQMSLADRRKYLSLKQKEWYRRKNPGAKPPKTYLPYAEMDAGTTRVCVSCAQKLPRTAEYFKVGGTTRLRMSRRCLICAREAGTAQRAKNKFGLTLAEYRSILTRGCAICRATERLVMDHCHHTGEVRTALCTTCNSGLG